MTTLLEVLDSLGEEAEMVSRNTLNYGGCCYFASVVAQELENIGIPAKVVARGSESYSCNHAWVEFKYRGRYWYYDSEHLERRAKAENAQHLYWCKWADSKRSAKEARRWYRLGCQKAGWNRRFRREEFIPRISRLIRQYRPRLAEAVR